MDAVKWRTALGYSRSALVYDSLVGHMYLAGLRRLLPHLRVPPYPAILDVGCGTGINLFEAARWFSPAGLLCGIDLSPGMVEVARAKAALLSVPAQFLVGDAERLPYPDGTFDLVVCNSVLHWFHDRGAALREIARVLKPGGQVALICAASPGFQEWFGLIGALTAVLRGPKNGAMAPRLPSVTEVAHLLAGAGLRIDHLANPVIRQRIRQPELFVRQMVTVAPQWAADLTPAEQAWVEAMAHRTLRQWSPLGFPNTWSAVEAVATRTAA